MKNIKTIIGAIFGIFGRRHLSAVYKWLEKGPVPFLPVILTPCLTRGKNLGLVPRQFHGLTIFRSLPRFSRGPHCFVPIVSHCFIVLYGDNK